MADIFGGNDSFGQEVTGLMNQNGGASAFNAPIIDPMQFSAFGVGNGMPGANGILQGMTSKDKWAAGLGLAGTAFAGAEAFKNWQMQDEYLKKMNEDQARKRKEDADYDAFKNSWSGGGGTNASSTTRTTPTSGVQTGTNIAPPVY